MRETLEEIAEVVLCCLVAAAVVTGIGFTCGATCGAIERGYQLVGGK